MKNWQKILKKYLTEPMAGGISRSGVDSGCAAFLLLRAVATEKKPLVAVFPELNPAERAAAECEALAALAGIPLRLLSIPECGRGKLLFPGGEARRARALNAALSEPFDLYIGSVHALIAPAPKPAETSGSTLVLRPGMELPPAELLERLVKLDYDDEYEATVSGEFARRGGIIDLFSPAHDFPCRVEFFGDEIDSLRSYAPDTQRSTGPLEEYRVIGRAGITAGGAAEADFFDYLAECDYRLLSIDPDASRERLEKYACEGAAARFDEIRRRCGERKDAYVFYDAVEAASHPEIPHADLEPSLPLPEREGG